MEIMQIPQIESQLNDFFLGHSFKVPYTIKKITTDTYASHWYMFEFNTPSLWEQIDELDVFMVSLGYKGFYTANSRLTYLKQIH